MRIFFLLVLVLWGCNRESRDAESKRVKCTFVRQAIPEPSTDGPAEVSTLKDPADPRFGVGDMIRADQQLDAPKQEKIIALYVKAEKEISRIQLEVDRLNSTYFRAVVNPVPDEAAAKDTKNKLSDAILKQVTARLNAIDQIEGVLGPRSKADRDIIERAFLREDRRRAQLENMKCDF